MNWRLCFCLAGLAGLLALNTCWAGPMSSTSTVALTPLAAQQAEKDQTASGKVTSVKTNSFSIEAKEGDATKTLDFVTNKDTKIEGELKAGANVQVNYRTEGGKNIATQVTVVI